ncbi:L-fucose:H+ symporter permease [Botrimarina hoheduenensis]|uniref:L-fucose-proton symporter n=1 Tax=Botrimarina hoheduenensis TaxID=2528000 RepID=A0A5C5VPS9_9BACT|nr:L-fucose:H+ symporter permease [Botrimarina hoheduenensis]TWT40648.1 L-fucose-proton symporter [Botrimarina hoheduenensis]
MDGQSGTDNEAQPGGSFASVVPREFWYPFALVTTLFALWGFANDITNPLVKAFKEIFLITNQQSSLVQTAFYGGYATMAIPAALVIRKFSYKTGILLGLSLYAIGALLFIPASNNMAFGLFLVALYVLTFGLAFLETAANPYILSMGPPETATRRLNFAQAFNPIGSLIGMIVASNVVLAGLQVGDFRQQQMDAHPEYATMLPGEVDGKVTEALEAYAENEPEAHGEMQSHDLRVVRTPYVVIAMVVIGVLLVFLLSKLPDTGHEEDPIRLTELLGRLATFRYVGGVIAQAFYVGAQIMCWTFIIHYGVTLLGLPAAMAQNWNIAAMLTFLVGRWLGTIFLLRHVDAGKALGLLAVGGAVATLGAIFTPGLPGIVCVVAISLFMSVMFPTIYGLALSNLTPNDAKLGSAGLIFAIVGGALMPPLQGGVIDTGTLSIGPLAVPLGFLSSEPVRASFALPLVCFFVIAAYGFAVASKPKAE